MGGGNACEECGSTASATRCSARTQRSTSHLQGRRQRRGCVGSGQNQREKVSAFERRFGRRAPRRDRVRGTIDGDGTIQLYALSTGMSLAAFSVSSRVGRGPAWEMPTCSSRTLMRQGLSALAKPGVSVRPRAHASAARSQGCRRQ